MAASLIVPNGKLTAAGTRVLSSLNAVVDKVSANNVNACILIYRTNCGHCKAFHPIYEQLVHHFVKLRANLTFYEYDIETVCAHDMTRFLQLFNAFDMYSLGLTPEALTELYHRERNPEYVPTLNGTVYTCVEISMPHSQYMQPTVPMLLVKDKSAADTVYQWNSKIPRTLDTLYCALVHLFGLTRESPFLPALMSVDSMRDGDDLENAVSLIQKIMQPSRHSSASNIVGSASALQSKRTDSHYPHSASGAYTTKHARIHSVFPRKYAFPAIQYVLFTALRETPALKQLLAEAWKHVSMLIVYINPVSIASVSSFELADASPTPKLRQYVWQHTTQTFVRVHSQLIDQLAVTDGLTHTAVTLPQLYEFQSAWTPVYFDTSAAHPFSHFAFAASTDTEVEDLILADSSDISLPTLELYPDAANHDIVAPIASHLHLDIVLPPHHAYTDPQSVETVLRTILKDASSPSSSSNVESATADASERT